MPEQERYHTNRVHPEETHQAEMDALIDQAIADAVEEADGRSIADEAADWLDDIDAVLESVDVALLPFLQKGGQ